MATATQARSFLMIPLRTALSGWLAGACLVAVVLAHLASDPAPCAPVQASAVGSPSGSRPELRGLEAQAGIVVASGRRLRAEMPFRTGVSNVGWGMLRLDARPADDEVRVRVVVDAPTQAPRWTGPCALVLDVDGERTSLDVEPAGARLKAGGFHDAVRVSIGIDVLRRIARASEVRAEVCGDSIELGAERGRTLEDFVERFDALALPAAPARERPVTVAPELPDEPIADPDARLESA